MFRPAKLIAALLSAATLLGVAAAPSAASRAPTRAESTAIKRAFFQRFPKATTTIRSIRVSTVDRRFSSVRYARDIDESAGTARAATVYEAPKPVFLKKVAGGKWKSVPPAKVPAKVGKDLGKKRAVSDIRLTGDIEATLTNGARCSDDGVSLYDRTRDLLFSVQLFVSKGPGTYDAKAVDTIVAIYRNSGTELAYESGQPNDADAPSGFFHMDRGGWGIVAADLYPPPVGGPPGSVAVKGHWTCI